MRTWTINYDSSGLEQKASTPSHELFGIVLLRDAFEAGKVSAVHLL